MNIVTSGKKILYQIRQDSLLTNSYALTVSNLLTALGGYLYWVFAARRFEETAIGLASAAISSMGLIDLITNLGLGTGLIRFLAHETAPRGYKLIRIATTLRAVLVILATTIFLMGLPVWGKGLAILTENWSYGVAFFAIVILNALFLTANAVFIAMRLSSFVLYTSLLFNLSKIITVLLIPVKLDVLGLLLVVMFAFVITTGAQFLYYLPRIGDRFVQSVRTCSNQIKGFLIYSASNQLADSLMVLPQVALPLMVLNALGPEANAHFYTAWMTAGILRSLSLSVAQAAFAESVAEPSLLKDKLQKALVMIMTTILTGVGFIALFAPKLLAFFGDSYSTVAASLLRLLALSVIPVGPISIYISALRVRKQTRELMILSIIWVSAGLSGAYLGIRLGGMEGVAKGWLAGQVIALVVIGMMSLGQWATTDRYENKTHR